MSAVAHRRRSVGARRGRTAGGQPARSRGQRRRSPVSRRTGRQARRTVGARLAGAGVLSRAFAVRRGPRARPAVRGGAAQRGAARSVHAPAGRAPGQPRLLGAGRPHALPAAEATDGGGRRAAAAAWRRQLPVLHGAAAGDGVDVCVERAARGADARYRSQLQRDDRPRSTAATAPDSPPVASGRSDSPSFTRVSPGRRQLHQAMVGPYASLDEAERVQRRLARSGFAGARIFVDETLRNAPRNEIEAAVAEGNPNILLIGAPDRVSLVFELPLEPRQVRERRTENVLDTRRRARCRRMCRSSSGARLKACIWSSGSSIEGVQASETGEFLRAHVTLPEFARTNVRTEGRRVYVDLTWPMTAPDAVALTRRRRWRPRSQRPAPAPSPRRPSSARGSAGIRRSMRSSCVACWIASSRSSRS